jgi:hypothetical protein
MLFVFAFIGLISLVILVDAKFLVFGLADEVVPGAAHEAFREEWVMIEVDRCGSGWIEESFLGSHHSSGQGTV